MTKSRICVAVSIVVVMLVLASARAWLFGETATPATARAAHEPLKPAALKSVSASELPAIQLAEGAVPAFLALKSDGTKLFIGSDTGQNNVICVATDSGQQLWASCTDVNAVGGAVAPRWIAHAMSSPSVFVLDWYSPEVEVMDSDDGSPVTSYELGEEPVMMSHGLVNGEAILMVTTQSEVYYFQESPFTFLRSETLPGSDPQKIAFDAGSSRLFIPLYADDLLVAHQLTWNGNSLVVTQTQEATGSVPLACVPNPSGAVVAVACSGDGSIRLHNKLTLAPEGNYSGLDNVSDAVYKNGKLLVTRYYDPAAGEGWSGDFLVFDFSTTQSVRSALPDRYPVSIEATSIPGFAWVVDEGVYVGGGQNGPGALLKMNLANAQVVESHSLNGSNLWTAYDANTQKLFVSEPLNHCVRVFQLP